MTEVVTPEELRAMHAAAIATAQAGDPGFDPIRPYRSQVADTFPAPMDDSGFNGPVGNAVLSLEAGRGRSEALLIYLLVFHGNAVGRTAHALTGATQHHAKDGGGFGPIGRVWS